jgi:hypothetical protein
VEKSAPKTMVTHERQTQTDSRKQQAAETKRLTESVNKLTKLFTSLCSIIIHEKHSYPEGRDLLKNMMQQLRGGEAEDTEPLESELEADQEEPKRSVLALQETFLTPDKFSPKL